MAEASSMASEATDEGSITVPGKGLGVAEASEPHETAASDEGPRILESRSPSPLSNLDNRDEDVSDGGLNACEGEGLEERSEQPVEVALDDIDGGMRDGPKHYPGRGGWY
ncbi:hypothetical protein AMTR_s00005p00211250 [Amborella trichopoda]|uniref:Uncharacterized protein n=1 Tax=Amborella trichopoda TaxID=13333 RepID=W1PI80_AMBTC|nr:hypothetical protein AMTR_s00005p00211250 [Amborella trichopoda]